VETVLRGLVITRALILSRLTGTVAVMDRYTYCQYTSITVRGGRPGVARMLFRFLPQPDLVFYLAVPPLVAQARVEARGKDHEELDYLTASDAAYRGLPEAVRFTVVDAGVALGVREDRGRVEHQAGGAGPVVHDQPMSSRTCSRDSARASAVTRAPASSSRLRARARRSSSGAGAAAGRAPGSISVMA